jgi:transcriptional regulator with XRE-family HTH domain
MTQTLPTHVAAEIRAEMARRRMTQRELGEILDLPQSSISKRLQGQTPFNVAELEKVAAALNVPVSRFFRTAESAA